MKFFWRMPSHLSFSEKYTSFQIQNEKFQTEKKEGKWSEKNKELVMNIMVTTTHQKIVIKMIMQITLHDQIERKEESRCSQNDE